MNSCTPCTDLYLVKLSVTYKYKIFLVFNAFKMKISLILAFMQLCMQITMVLACRRYLNHYGPITLANVVGNQQNFNVVYSPLKGLFNDKLVVFIQCH